MPPLFLFVVERLIFFKMHFERIASIHRTYDLDNFHFIVTIFLNVQRVKNIDLQQLVYYGWNFVIL